MLNPSATAALPAQALVPDLACRRLALQALLGGPEALDEALLAAVLACAPRELPPRLQPEDPALAEAQRAVQRWRSQAPTDFDAMLSRAVELLLRNGRPQHAAQLALNQGWAGLQLQVLERAGWALLLSPQQALAGHLLKPNLLQPALQSGELLGLRLAWTIEALGEPHTVERLLPAAEGLSEGLRATLQARVALAFDQCERALEEAKAAIDAFPNDLQLPALMARATLGRACLAAGQPRAALAPLTAALKGARRDDCLLLQIEALEALSELHHEFDDEAGAEPGETARFFGQQAEALRQQHGLLPGPLSSEHYFAFPLQVAQAQTGLNAGQVEAAAHQIEALSQRESQTFYCYRWRNRLLQAQIHLASLQHQLPRLHHWAALETSDERPALPAPASASLCDFERAWLQACAALLAARPWPEARLRAWADAMQARGLQRLAWQQALLLALSMPGSGPGLEALRDCLQALRSRRQLDTSLERVRLLAPKLVGPLAALLAQASIVHHPLARQNARHWLQVLRGGPALAALLPVTPRDTPGPEDQTANRADPHTSTPPFGLTRREWQVLQLIGSELSNEQIAAQLFVSVTTVKTHINRLYAKLHISSREEAMQRARTVPR